MLGVVTAFVAGWDVWTGSRSDYYASIALSMSQNWSNFFFGSFDPSGTVTLDKIPGSFWVPALFVKVFGFSDWAVILPNSLAAVAATLIVAVTAKCLLSPTAGLIAGAVMASTPILIAVSRSNQPESFFVLGLALTAWASAKALQRRSFGWLTAAGLFVALSFQTYMLEAWAIWPALAAGFLCTKQPFLRKLWQTAVAGVVSLAASVSWIVVVAVIPAAQRPYIGSTLHNDPWEMVFGYNGLGRFGTDTADAAAYRSFTPPFSGSAGVLRLFNEQVAGQIAWMIPTAILGVVVLAVLRFSAAITVFVGVWLVTFLAMFSAVAGMHQFYTAALAVPMALAVGLAFAQARHKRKVWAQAGIIAVAGISALAIGAFYGGYSIVVAVIQAILGALAIGLLVAERRRGSLVRIWTALLAAVALVLTPAAWSVVSMSHPSSTNPVAGGVAEVSFGGGNPFGSRAGGGGSAQGAPQGVPQGTPRGASQGARPPGGAGGPGGSGGRIAASSLDWLEQHRGDARYLVAAFGAQIAATIILDSGGQSVLPIGGFNSGDPVPTLDAFRTLVTDGALRYVYAPDLIGATTVSSTATSSEQIRAWVAQNCTAVADLSGTGIYDCSP
ncbi:4-amino-4-deoxy-L-arabinose transferase [Microbacterium rhizomatis]|uniref:4-amino-4-deoxy-L-arabinose transferase n=2 Tax=Microbacterium rhizomatis TaxID=1631477 RepID=A0A5J5J6G3_9MICO|nr:4-amino-4-deoxy-L-arabinose transferase [Microbacterium rhizomatis]